MQYVPLRSCLSITSSARIVIAEAINADVPQWLITANQLGFYGADQIALNSANDYKSATEVADVQVCSEANACCMLSNSIVKVCRSSVTGAACRHPGDTALPT